MIVFADCEVILTCQYLV